MELTHLESAVERLAEEARAILLANKTEIAKAAAAQFVENAESGEGKMTFAVPVAGKIDAEKRPLEVSVGLTFAVKTKVSVTAEVADPNQPGLELEGDKPTLADAARIQLGKTLKENGATMRIVGKSAAE